MSRQSQIRVFTSSTIYCSLIVLFAVCTQAWAQSSPSPSPTAEPTPTATPIATPTPEESPSASEVDKPKSGRVYVDEDYDFQINAPEGWFRKNPRNIAVAGHLCRAWTPGDTASILVFRVMDEKVHIPLELIDKTAEAMASARKVDVLEQEVRELGGKQAGWLVMVGDGNGGAIDGFGNIRTVQHMVAIPRSGDALILMFITPEKDYSKYLPTFETILKSLKVGGEQTDAQKEST